MIGYGIGVDCSDLLYESRQVDVVHDLHKFIYGIYGCLGALGATFVRAFRSFSLGVDDGFVSTDSRRPQFMNHMSTSR